MSEADHYAELQGFMFRRGERLAVPFKENVVDWIMACRLDDGGIPYFRTGFAKRPFKANSTFFAQGICYLGANMIDSRFFRDVPPEDFKHMAERHDDYLYILEKYGSKKLVNRAIRASVVVI